MKPLRERIEEARLFIRGRESEPAKPVKARSLYKRGAKDYLTSFNVGEIRKYDGAYRYDSLRSTAAHLKKEYGCMFCFHSCTEGKFITRIR